MSTVDENLSEQIVSIKTTNVLVVNLPQPCPTMGFRVIVTFIHTSWIHFISFDGWVACCFLVAGGHV